MSDLSRRLFLGAAGAAGAAAVAGSALDTPDRAPRGMAGPIVARVRDVASGEVTVYVGTREVRRHDPALAASLARAAATAH
jgi:hypothetical protein